jgi:WhiB family redox-sensing transcriptional regulator
VDGPREHIFSSVSRLATTVRTEHHCVRVFMQHLKEYHVMDWRDKAACLTADPELFFPVGNTGPAVDQIEKAKAVCARCNVTEVCLQYALETNQDYGVWGGLSEDERRALKRRAARARRAS